MTVAELVAKHGVHQTAINTWKRRPDHVWCADITYIPMRRGLLYLVAIMDRATRRVLSLRRSNSSP